MKKTDMLRLSNLLAGCSICFNSGSTVSIDALIFEKPVILTSFDANRKLNYWKSARRLVDYTHQRKFVELGGAEVVHDYDELTARMNEYLSNPLVKLEQRKYAIEQECYLNDGQSTQRVVAAMNHLLKQNKLTHA